MGSTSSTPSPSPSPSPSPTPSTDPIISPHPPHIHQFLKHSLINHSHLFTTLPQLSLSEIDRALDMTIARARRHEYLPGTEVQTGTLHGDIPPTPSTPSHIYLVERGHLSIQMYKNGNWMHIHDASRGDVINDLAVYYQQPKPRALVVVDGNDDTPAQTPLDDTTPTPAVIWSIPAPAFTSFIQSSPYISQTLQSRTWLRSHLTHHELFTDVDDERMRETLVARFRKEKIPKGTHIVEVGDIGERFYLIEEGTCEVLAPSVPSPPLRNTSSSTSSTSSTSSDPSSQLVAVGTRGPGETFGEIALLYNVRRNATIKALTDCTIWSVDSTTFLNSCHQGSVYLKNIFWEHASVIDPKTGERLMNATDFFDAMRLATSDREQQRALRSQRRREEKLAKGEKWTEKDEEMENKRIKKEKERKHELMSEAQLKLLFQLADQSGDNLIAFGEFVILHSLLSKPHTHNRFKIAFRLFDRNKDGFISRDEFINCMRSLAKDRGQQINLESDPFVRQLFPTPTSVLTYDQFEALLLKDDLPTYLTHLRHDLREINAYLFRLNTMMTLDELATPATDAGGSFAHNPKLHWKNLVAGGIAGAVSRTLVSPMERLKLLFQMQGRPPKYTSIVQALRVIWIEDGIRGFFRGNLSNVVRITPASALQFFFYDVYKTWMFGDQTTLSPWQRLLAGGNAGATACIITYPLDFIRARLTLQSGPNPPYRGIMHGITTVIKVEGVRGLYKGMWPSIVGVYPYIGIDFAVYETLKLHVVKNFSSLEKDHNRIMLLACGAVAGVTGQTVAYPLDLVRRRLQVQGFEQAKYTYKGGIINTMQTIVKEEGLKGLYKGMVPNLMKVVPAVSTSFVVYEHMRQYLDRAT